MVLTPRTLTLPKLLLKPGRWTVGSAATCSYRVVGIDVQPRHALILCGGLSVILKPWDARTWCNGQPVRGEIRLQPGDQLKIGSVEFQIEPTTTDAPFEQRPELTLKPAATEPIATSLSNSSDAWGTASEQHPTAEISVVAELQSDVWDEGQLSDQIQELRHELSQSVGTQTSGKPSPNPIGSQAQTTSANIFSAPATHDELGPLRARVADLEQVARVAQADAERASEEFESAHDEWSEERTRLEGELNRQQVLLQSREVELDQARITLAQQVQNWTIQTSQWHVDQTRLQSEVTTLREALQVREATALKTSEELQTEATRWRSHSEQLTADHELQRSEWGAEHAGLLEQLLQLEDRLHSSESSDNRQQELDLQAEQLNSDRASLDRERAEFDSAKANQIREKQVLAHSWEWLQTERRKLFGEKEQAQSQRNDWLAQRDEWTAQQVQRDSERQQWLAEQHKFQKLHDQFEQQRTAFEAFRTEKDRWDSEREQAESELNAAAEELEVTRNRVSAQQHSLSEEWRRLHAAEKALQEIRAELDARVADIARGPQLANVERTAAVPVKTNPIIEVSDTLTVKPTAQTAEELTTDNRWSSDLTEQSNEQGSEPASVPTVSSVTTSEREYANVSLSDAWSVGVDLTDPYRNNLATHAPQNPVAHNNNNNNNDWSTSEAFQLCEEVAISEPTDGTLSAPPPLPLENSQGEAIRKPSPTRLWTRSLASATSLQVFLNESDRDKIWATSPASRATQLSDFVTSNFASSSNPSTAWDEPASEMSAGLGQQAFATIAPDVKSATEIADAKELRTQLAEMFNLPGLTGVTQRVAPPYKARFTLELDPGKNDVVSPTTVDAGQRLNESKTFDPAGRFEPARSPAPEPLDFSNDQDTDDSVSRYMHHLLERSRNRNVTLEPSDPNDVEATVEPAPSVAMTVEEISAPSVSEMKVEAAVEEEIDWKIAPNPSRPPKMEPVHRQDKDALRNATEQMRHVANLQTQTNVQASSWTRLKESIKMKSGLAAFAFILSLGLLFLGYRGQRLFTILGVCSACVGVLTWVDLFVAISVARSKAAVLKARNQPK